MTFADALDNFVSERLDALAIKEKSNEYKNLIEQAQHLQAALIATFGTAQKDLFMQWQDVEDQCNGQDCEDAYKAGLLDGITLLSRL